jgi:ankyrin repeat protein
MKKLLLCSVLFINGLVAMDTDQNKQADSKYAELEDYTKEFLLHRAVEEGKLDVVDFLIRHGFKEVVMRKNERGETPLQKAIAKEHNDIVAYLKPIVEQIKEKNKEFEDQVTYFEKQVTEFERETKEEKTNTSKNTLKGRFKKAMALLSSQNDN